MQTRLLYEKTLSEERMYQAHALMVPEFISRGGNIRDIEIDELFDLARIHGELWTASDNGQVLASFTLLTLTGNRSRWGYLNHGIVAPEKRHQGGMLMETLLRSCLNKQRNMNAYFTISTAQSIFSRLGFIHTDIATLEQIDPAIAEITKHKVRPNTHAVILSKIL